MIYLLGAVLYKAQEHWLRWDGVISYRVNDCMQICCTSHKGSSKGAAFNHCYLCCIKKSTFGAGEIADMVARVILQIPASSSKVLNWIDASLMSIWHTELRQDRVYSSEVC